VCENSWQRDSDVSINTYQCTDQGCQIYLGSNIPNWEKYNMRPQTIPNGHKIYQMAIKYSKWS
jgi:hypothetical protein